MNLYEVYNGFNGDGPVFVTVVALNEEQARSLASKAFKEDAHSPFGTTMYEERYWTNLEVELLASCNEPYVSGVKC
ncbi:MAG: hypothetical protein NAG76_22600 [Candidatus Pristimantibacillus lignocellulolyticus]|uniref:Uncharacterized protein n=1 Tax=Candidatus Pristimantibacillus lignocellulolyticus TaxID=2994561 RepID=A0A9J6ZEI6_9BACL|nr:MAG: hypothetical protein NAG76_22600 [Candidatus Pristimantibacillus lignocellulolyticus]